MLLGVLWRDALHAAYLVAFVLHAASQFFGGGPGIRFLQHSTKYRLLRCGHYPFWIVVWPMQYMLAAW